MSELNVLQDSPWYKEGLPFNCTGCGQCCTGSPGYTWLSVDEIEKMAEYLGITIQKFGMRYLRKIDDRYALTEVGPQYDCVFLRDKKCLVYPVRPVQCQTFPFWPENLQSKEAWDEAAKRCEGITCDGPRVPLEHIEHERLRDIAATNAL